MEAVAAVMRALLLLLVFGVLASVFTRLRVFPRVTACWFPVLVIGRGRSLHRVGRHWRPGSTWLPVSALVGVLTGLFFSRLPLPYSM